MEFKYEECWFVDKVLSLDLVIIPEDDDLYFPRYRGEFNKEKLYFIGDFISYNDKVYLCKKIKLKVIILYLTKMNIG